MKTNFPFLRRLEEQDGEVLAEVTMRLGVGDDFIEDGSLAEAALELWIRSKLGEFLRVKRIDVREAYD